jgi:hypothetical protein
VRCYWIAELLLKHGFEFRCAHFSGCRGDDRQSPWSHGDPNFGNVIFDQSTQRARLVDFETVHAVTSSTDDRHAEEITVFLLDLLGSVSEENLLALAAAFLAGYNRPAIWALARKALGDSQLVSADCGGASVLSIRQLGPCVDASPCCARAGPWTGHQAFR